jgi:hypothetical protein
MFGFFRRRKGRVFFAKLGKKGRLGNQLFQIASTIGIARTNGMQPVFPEWTYEKYFRRKPPKATPRDSNLPEVLERSFSYHPLVLSGSCVIDGYFQSERYFRQHSNEIVAQFSLRQEYFAEVERLFAAYGFPDCSMHVRRGDYVGNAGLYDLGESAYYPRALSRLAPRARILCFSDDPHWCRAKFSDPRISFVEPHDDILDLFLFSRCQTNIISNSTYSWWGAWLNPRCDAAVFAPDRWFAGTNVDPAQPIRATAEGFSGYHDASGVIPQGWTKLNCEANA